MSIEIHSDENISDRAYVIEDHVFDNCRLTNGDPAFSGEMTFEAMRLQTAEQK
jgi:hypothetical protein